MPALQIISSEPFAGRSTVAAALALGLSRSGLRVRLERVGDDGAAAEDARCFAELLFASSAGQPVPAEKAGAESEGLAVIEPPAGASLPGMAAVLVVRGASPAAAPELLKPLGDRLIGTIATAVVPARIESVARDLTNAGLRPLAILPEDRLLAAPSVAEIRSTLAAQLLYDGDNAGETVEDLLIGPVYADPARPHFRRFASKAILAPFNKTDLLLAAIETQAACLIITGGRQPSPYVLDRAQHDSTTVLLSADETPQTLTNLGQAWLSSRFRGERKAEAAFRHLEGRVDFAGLARKL
jgi:hypothetical protein